MILGIIVFVIFYLIFGKLSSLGIEAIFEDFCNGAPVWLSYVIIFIWPLTIPIFAVATVVYFILMIFD